MQLSSLLLLLGPALTTALAAGAAFDSTPVSKVVGLLSDLRDAVAGEGQAEASTYKEFACFCKETSGSKAAGVRGEANQIDGLAAGIAENTAGRERTKTELAKLKKDQDANTAELAESKAQCAKQKAEYEATSADLDKALRGLADAVNAMETSKPGLFLDIRKNVQQTLDLAGATRFAGAPKRRALSKLLQQHAKVDPNDPEYKYQSQHIIDVLKRLQSEYGATKSEVETEWGKTLSTCEKVHEALNEKIRLNAQAIVQAETDIEGLTAQVAADRRSLLEQQASLKDSQLYIKDLTARCEQRARDWDQRSQMRHDELKALNEAIDILENQVAGNATANVRAMLLQHSPRAQQVRHRARAVIQGSQGVSFLQAGTSAMVRAHGLSDIVRGGLSTKARKEKAVKLLAREASRLRSMALNSLVMHVGDDPFATVKVLIQKLIERLIREAAAEATKEGFCDTELGKSRLQRKHRWEEVNRLLSEIGTLNAKRDQLVEDIAELIKGIRDLTEELSTAQRLRNETHAENMDTIDKANKGVTALRDAVQILKAFYKRAAKAEVAFVQESPVDADTSGAGFAGAYKGKQESSVAIFGLLAVLESDFERTLRVTTKAEQEQAAEFVLFKRDSEANIAGKTTKQQLNEQDLEITKNKIQAALGDLQENQDLVDKASKAIEALKSVCIDSGMSYSERVSKRRDEINALKRAVCILDTDHAEDECPQPEE